MDCASADVGASEIVVGGGVKGVCEPRSKLARSVRSCFLSFFLLDQ